MQNSPGIEQSRAILINNQEHFGELNSSSNYSVVVLMRSPDYYVESEPVWRVFDKQS